MIVLFFLQSTTLCGCIENINLKYLIGIGLGQAIFSKTELHQTVQITFLIATWSSILYFMVLANELSTF